MELLISPSNEVLVTIEKKYYDEIRFASGVKLYRDNTFHPEESAMLWGTVHSTPLSVSQRPDYKGYTMPLQPGDEILMRYDVVFAYKEQPDRDSPIYKNLLYYEGKQYWRVDVQKIFGFKRNGMLTMINGYIMCDPFPVYVSAATMIIPESLRQYEHHTIFKIRCTGTGLSTAPDYRLCEGDCIICKPDVAQRYEIDEDVFYILKQSHILGKYPKQGEKVK